LATSKWALESGNSTPNNSSVYGTKGIPSVTNIPGARMGALPFKGKKGSLWLFGGVGTAGYYNDLWRFVPDTSCIKFCSDSISPRTCPAKLKKRQKKTTPLRHGKEAAVLR
jgi:hypothetical protein